LSEACARIGAAVLLGTGSGIAFFMLDGLAILDDR
jgi:uncharacterized membrane protein